MNTITIDWWKIILLQSDTTLRTRLNKVILIPKLEVSEWNSNSFIVEKLEKLKCHPKIFDEALLYKNKSNFL